MLALATSKIFGSFKTFDTLVVVRFMSSLRACEHGTTWGASAACLRTTAMALIYSCAEYCSSSWLNSAHAKKVDVELNRTMRIITGTVKSTPVEWLPALCNIEPPDIRRQSNLLSLFRKTLENENVPLHADLALPMTERLKSRKPAISTAKILHTSQFNPKEVWKENWTTVGLNSQLFNFENHSARSKEFTLPRKLWCNLNRLRTGHGRCKAMLHKWILADDPSCECGCAKQTMNHLVMDCPVYKYDGDFSDFKNLTSQALTWLSSLNL